jgi:hypothetical protein
MSTRTTVLAGIAALGVLFASFATPASAHHSFAMFDRANNVTINGTVKEFQWTNPHIFIQVMVRGPQGALEEWSVEGGSPNSLYRQGWDNKTFQPGQQVSLLISPLKTGAHGGSLVYGELPGGKTVGNRNFRAPG